MNPVRHLWTLIEPLHAVTYFAPEARAAYEEVGLRGFWRGYFAGRAAPLGAVTAAPVTALFFGFAPRMVERALPDIWSRISPADALRCREAGAASALRSHGTTTEAADLLWAAASGARTSGRALAAANAALPAPEDPHARLWLATTVLREHRGDGHVTALVTNGVDGCEALVWRDAIDGLRGELQGNRGWTDEEWDAARQRLAARGWVDGDGRATAAGRAAHARMEELTDELAAQPWAGTDTERLVALLTPAAEALHRVIPYPNAMGLPRG
ncbi:hypothetical protein Val02_73380 [Virgisporangium aliadipatigenens]|uniref:SalK n=1 Tax=Virgisporangium aliadipatigenens TaxID=741659 RepID=A0A8J3YTZ3_9ACTN|nr:hypothetical protein [Virgisporangium aliadipatigenens]GIJ50452.1 hypothetical protein Val02_73380 [Virgisporangium aliadipatigenens]